MKQKLKAVKMKDIAAYRIPHNPVYSPDGTYLAFEVMRADLEKNEYHTDVWLSRNGQARQVTWSIDANIVLWEDDDTLIIRRVTKKEETGVTELFRLSVHGGEAEPFMTLPFALLQMKKTEGGYAASVRIDAEDPDAWKDKPEERKKKAEAKKEEKDYQVVDELPYWFNGAGFTNKKRTALFFVALKEGKTVIKRLTAPYFDLDSFCVDGTKIYYAGAVRKAKMSLTNKVFVYDTVTKRSEGIYRKNDFSTGRLFVMGGRLFGHASDMKTYGVNETSNICLIGEDRIVPVYVPEVSLYSSVIGDTAEGGVLEYADGSSYLTLATIRDHNAVFAFSEGETGLEKKTVWEMDGMACSMAGSKEKIALVFQDWNHVAEVYEMNRDGSDFKKITCLNDEALIDRYIAEPVRVDYKSCGYDLRGWVLLPQDFSEKKTYPAVLDVHGGPRCAYGETFFHEMQLWAARGFVVFFTNIKGSDGRGDAFADIRNDYGGTDFQNLMDFTDEVLMRYPNIDQKRVCVTGGSYGGFMTNWIIGHTDRFVCAASQRSISNWISFGFMSDIGGYFGPDQNGAKGMYGAKNTEILWNHSPLKYADKVKTPTLFIHSDEDYRCPLPEGMQMMQALAGRGVETRMCIFNGENHELSRSGKPKHRVRRLKEITEWFVGHTGE